MLSGKGIDKWTELELTRINKGLVARKKRLCALLEEETPHCTTREGETYRFEVAVLKLLATALHEGEDLQLPMTLHFSSESRDSCYISDETAAEVLRRLERFGEAYPYRDGRMWLPNSLAYALIQKYPTAIQGLFL
jgi:uncharacterized protein (UPF0216 family)